MKGIILKMSQGGQQDLTLRRILKLTHRDAASRPGEKSDIYNSLLKFSYRPRLREK